MRRSFCWLVTLMTILLVASSLKQSGMSMYSASLEYDCIHSLDSKHDTPFEFPFVTYAPDQINSRMKRNGTPFPSTLKRKKKQHLVSNNHDEFLKHVTIVAHITNGIALQSGLMNGGIKIEEAVGELLNFGEIKVAEVASFKSDKIVALTRKIKETKTSIDSSAIALENDGLKWNTLRINSGTVDDFMDATKTDAYFDEIIAIKNAKATIFQPLEDVLRNLQKLEQGLVEVGKLDANMADTRRAEAANVLMTSHTSLESLIRESDAQLARDVSDPWIKNMFKLKDSKEKWLNDALQPIIKISDHLNAMNDKLKPLSSSNVAEHLSDFAQFQEELSKVSKDSKDSIDIISKLLKCRTGYSTAKLVADTRKKFENFRNIEKAVNDLEQAISKLKNIDLKTANDEFFGILKFSDISNLKTTTNEVKTALAELQKTDALVKLKKVISDISNVFKVVDTKPLTSTILDDIADSGKHDFVELRTDLQTESQFHTCLQGYKDEAQKMGYMIQAVQRMREFHDDELKNVELAASAVSKVASDLSKIDELQKSMSNEQIIVDLNKMPNSAENSLVISQSVKSLQDAYQLKSLESSLSQLRATGNSVKNEIYKISDPEKRKTVSSEWGDHKKDMDELQDVLKNVKSFDSKLDVSKAKTLGEYSTSLKDLSTFPDAKIEASKKMKALDLLIESTKDPKTKSELEQSKKTLASIPDLDLLFSSHKTQYQSAPSAFTALHDFLDSFFATEHLSEKSSSIVLYIVEEAKLFFEDILASVPPPTQQMIRASHKFLPRQKHRYPDGVLCNETTAVKNPKIHMNRIEGTNMFAAQAPIGIEEEVPGQSVQTIDDFFDAIFNNGITHIVMLCHFFEGGSRKCGKYFEEAANGVYNHPQLAFIIETVSSEVILGGDVIERTLKITRKSDGAVMKVIHYHHIHWPDKFVPNSFETIYKLLERVKKHKTIVHCSAGIGRTVSFIAMRSMADKVIKDPEAVVISLLCDVREMRCQGIQTTIQLHWVMNAVVYTLVKECNLPQEINTDLAEHFEIAKQNSPHRPQPAAPRAVAIDIEQN
uniref:WSN domain-containing protein n=1 Tax=Caenorhabditis tropicalis TaxID=1561998 RepID=A0A1I7TQJ7_9PELO